MYACMYVDPADDSVAAVQPNVATAFARQCCHCRVAVRETSDVAAATRSTRARDYVAGEEKDDDRDEDAAERRRGRGDNGW